MVSSAQALVRKTRGEGETCLSGGDRVITTFACCPVGQGIDTDEADILVPGAILGIGDAGGSIVACNAVT